MSDDPRARTIWRTPTVTLLPRPGVVTVRLVRVAEIIATMRPEGSEE